MRTLAVLALFVFGGILAAADDKKPIGTWTKKAEGFDLKFTFKKDNVFVFGMDNGTDGAEMESKCTFEKDGTVKCEVTKFTKKGNFNAEKEVGYKFSFKFEVTGKKAKVSAIEGKDIDETAKSVVEGEYEKAAD